MKLNPAAAFLGLLLLWFLSMLPAFGQAQHGIELSKSPDFSTIDRSFDASDILYARITAPDIDYTDIRQSTFRLKPDEGGNDFVAPLTNHLDGSYAIQVNLANTDPREDDWEVRVFINDDNGKEFRTRIDINIGDDDGVEDFQDDELEFTGRIDSLTAESITVDGFLFLIGASTEILNDNNDPVTLEDLSAGQIVEIRGDRQRDGVLSATRIKVEDNFGEGNNSGSGNADEIEFTGLVDSVSTSAIVVTGIEFQVDGNTSIRDDNNLAISLTDILAGMIVEIRGERQGENDYLATDIKIEDSVRGNDEIEFTGAVGAIDGASITVDGESFIVSENTAVFDNNNDPIAFSELVVGQVVEIKGFRQADGSIHAVRIKVEDRGDDEVELTGEIESINGSSLQVAGLTFLVDGSTIILDNDNQPILLADLSPGLIVEVRADVQADGSLLASDIKIEDRLEDEVEVRALVDNVGDSLLVVLGQAFIVLPNTEVLDNNKSVIDFSTISAGDIVEIRADLLPGNLLLALRIELEDNDPTRVRVQGPVDAVESDTLTIAGMKVMLASTTTVMDQDGNTATLGDLAVGQSVDVDAEGQSVGAPVATQIRIKKVARVTGAIAAVTENSITVAGATVQLDVNTLVLGSRNVPLTIAALSVGQFAKVNTEFTGAGLVASTVELIESSFTSVGIETAGEVPERFVLNQNYPNPFNPVTTITFDVFGTQAGNIALEVYNVLGQSVRTLFAGELRSGHYEFEWDGRNDLGQQLASGLYLYQLRAENLVQTKTMVLIK